MGKTVVAAVAACFVFGFAGFFAHRAAGKLWCTESSNEECTDTENGAGFISSNTEVDGTSATMESGSPHHALRAGAKKGDTCIVDV